MIWREKIEVKERERESDRNDRRMITMNNEWNKTLLESINFSLLLKGEKTHHLTPWKLSILHLALIFFLPLLLFFYPWMSCCCYLHREWKKFFFTFFALFYAILSLKGRMKLLSIQLLGDEYICLPWIYMDISEN